MATPVWVVALGGDEVGFWTSSESGKAKRLRHISRVLVQPCDLRGRIKQGSAEVEASARLVDGAELEKISERIEAKYKNETKFTKLAALVISLAKRKRMPYGDRGVIVALPS